MSRSLMKCKHIPGWVPMVLNAVKNGQNDVNAAGSGGVSTTQVRQRIQNDPAFKQQYEEAVNQGSKRLLRRIV